jgi:thiol-disulfide isomerase/thioredoxin
MFRLISRSFFVLAVLMSSVYADYEAGKKVFENKCSSCHGGYIKISILKDNFFEKNNELLKLKVPTVNMLAYAIMVSPMRIGDKNDPEMQKIEIEEFLKDYLYNPNRENSICDRNILKYYDKKDSMKGKVSEEEISLITDYIIEYRKQRRKAHPKKTKKLTDLSDIDKIKKQAKDENKLIIIEAMSETCHFCKKMKKEVFSKKDVQEAIDKNFIFVEVDVDKTKLPFALEKSYQKITPSFFVVSDKEKLINSYPGSWSKDDFLEILKENEKEK